jgi:hypothetical protein
VTPKEKARELAQLKRIGDLEARVRRLAHQVQIILAEWEADAAAGKPLTAGQRAWMETTRAALAEPKEKP